jgi:hypothetical protein
MVTPGRRGALRKEKRGVMSTFVRSKASYSFCEAVVDPLEHIVLTYFTQYAKTL